MIDVAFKKAAFDQGEKRMKLFALTIGVLVMSSLAQAKDLVVDMGGKDVPVQYRALDREITGKDRNAGNQGSAVECSFLYFSLLAKDDIRGGRATERQSRRRRQGLDAVSGKAGRRRFSQGDGRLLYRRERVRCGPACCWGPQHKQCAKQDPQHIWVSDPSGH